ncbi:hypothetical protein J437_LFUL002522 [Ladona fulva]|uniref:Uncharacterized protein n=1 Tax=Ladona fulva TaxID=123851 RepID=A0A8K0PAT8_LADFU|nr:hypothetical protein J437_LFUL002522 [Ladona fulva]
MGRTTCSKSFIRSLKHQTKEFLQNSTLHGVNYIADESLHFLERLAWLLICCLGVVSTAVTIALLWEKFQTNPTITGLDTDFHDWNVPFPADNSYFFLLGVNSADFIPNFKNEVQKGVVVKVGIELIGGGIRVVRGSRSSDCRGISIVGRSEGREGRVRCRTLRNIDLDRVIDIGAGGGTSRGWESRCGCRTFYQRTEAGYCYYDGWISFGLPEQCRPHYLKILGKWNSSKNILACGFETEVCPITEGKKERATLNNGDEIYMSNFLINLACLNYNNLKNFKGYVHANNLPQNDLRNLMWEVEAHCEDIFKDCKWKDGMLNSCCAPENPFGMRPIFTDHGFCYSFNSHKAERLKNELNENKVLEIYETDESWDFSFNVRDIKHYPIKVFIHDWNEVPATDDYPQHEWDGFVGHLEFSAKTTYTTPETRQLSVRQRQCIFPDEIKLTLDPDVYTHSVCVRECHANEAMEICGCVPPIINEIGKFKHCNLTGMSCLAEQKSTQRTGKSCTCELSCMNTVYEVETLTEGSCKGNECQPLHVGFVSWPMVRYKREVLFGWVDLLVSFGGVAGLFLGFSLLSGVEIIYYFVVRTFGLIFVIPAKKLRKVKNQNKKNKKSITKRVSFSMKDSIKLNHEDIGGNKLMNNWNKRETGKKEKLTFKSSKKNSVFPIEYLP